MICFECTISYIFISLLQTRMPNQAIKNDTIGIGLFSSTIWGANMVTAFAMMLPIMYTNGTNSGLNKPELLR